ncbi:MAG: D-glycero-beta-D-manno-heptose-7-phosphate kinase [Deltaproteobacteria bacterium]|jgi:D-beta-D-heptose 7-phosphate kinase/D-beta-D-heptose 1-phosphate adenosyltransferase|nr:D-glycero-beta-D-manno-heptose-7-phosphate kinase [Deltaproteobacteria bacterium]MCL5880037.1 D-glycero-beta-D-manno-heptose-7-phosphate kinase [Deltaproteobacteria bacterium]MDA8304110.1 D-glycero-beta-D-manno-heptose-7-phosphate kinase [Deltaproteobacteria bacterium]
MNENLLNIVKRFRKARILVIGDIMVDHFVYGTVDRISPEAPVPVVQVKSEKLMPGGAANVVNNVSELGAKVYVAGVVGNDYNGSILKRMVDKETVNAGGILTLDNFQTIIKTRVIAHNQQIVRFDKENNRKFSNGVYNELISGIKKIADDIDAVIISDYGKGLIERKFFSTVVNFLREKGKFISLDPKVENFKFYKNISILTPNINEAFGGSGIKIKDEKTLIKASKIILKKVKSDYLLVTRGESGMSLFYPDNKFEHLKARAKDVYDVTGAGDTVISTLTVAKSVGAGIFEACYIANAAASIAVSQLGTYAVGVEELMKVLSEAT